MLLAHWQVSLDIGDSLVLFADIELFKPDLLQHAA
jgi:hypothetical protein